MNILYYFEPWIELGRPHLRFFNLRPQLGAQIAALKKENPEVNIRILVGEGTYHQIRAQQYDCEGAEVTVLPESELRGFFHPSSAASSTPVMR